MSRHRIVRTMDYNDEYDGYDDVYGHSVDDDNCISPTDAQQWLYDRAKGQESLSSFIATHRNIEEEDEELDTKPLQRRDSEDFQMPILNDNDQARLNSCIDEIRTVVGECISEARIIDVVMKNNFDCAKSLNDILDESASSKPVKVSTEKPTIEKGIGPKLMERFVKPPTLNTTPIIVTPSTDTANIRRGFGVNSPMVLSPNGSGRSTPIIASGGSESQADPHKLFNRLTVKSSTMATTTTTTTTTPSSTSPIPTPSAAAASTATNRNVQELYAKERGDEKDYIHMIVIGHVDAGKSTLMGHMLVDLNEIPQRVMHKYEQESKKLGKQSFMYAWVLDETGEERSRGITMDIGSMRFSTDNKMVTLLDAPGHKDFIPNMISGATQADVALLVIDGSTGEFEAGFEQGGQTREHALLVRSLGVSQLCVVINKLDTVNWSQTRFDEIVTKLRTFLKQAGYRDADVTYVPCSGLTGENLVKTPNDSSLTAWYKGPTLINVIDNFKTPQRSIDKPFRMSISDIFKGTGSGFCISGRIETGALCVNDKILVCPLREQAIVKAITIDDQSRTSVFAGDHATVTLAAFDVNSISIGCILSEIARPIPIATKIQARIVVFNVKVPITIGYPVLLHHQSLIEPANITKLKAQLHKGTGEVIKKNPRFLTNNSCASVVLETTRPICIECYANCKELGRIMLRVGGVTIAAGLVTDIIK